MPRYTPATIEPNGKVSGAVWFERGKNPQQLMLRIPIETESLNAAMAATVALYEVTRGRVGADHRMDAA